MSMHFCHPSLSPMTPALLTSKSILEVLKKEVAASQSLQKIKFFKKFGKFSHRFYGAIDQSARIFNSCAHGWIHHIEFCMKSGPELLAFSQARFPNFVCCASSCFFWLVC